MRTLSLAALAVALTVPAAAQTSAPPPGFTALFNGKDFTGWYGWKIHEKGGSPVDLAKLAPEEKAKKVAAWTADMKANFRIENGELVNMGKGAYPATEKEYGDAEFLVECKISPTVDSGIYPKTQPQIQVWDPFTAPADDKLGRAKGSGGLWNNPAGYGGKDPLVRADKPAGEWNQFRILTLGDRVTVYLNGQLVVDQERMANYYDKGAPLAPKAPLLLQTHAPELEIRWRNIFVREIPPAEANVLLAKKATDAGFQPIFNGKDLTGWAGAVENYEVKDGAIVCKPKKGGVLHTKDEYADFVVNLEFKVPANGNNGLAIRYPGGTGDGAYIGMTELQVLDDAYKGIDPRQAHGSAYGMAAARRGYQRPVGEWNFQQVTVKGSTIVVELNGSRILDTDLGKVSEYLGGKPHPGKDRTSGFFGFCGHSDPVAFRNVMIKKLEK